LTWFVVNTNNEDLDDDYMKIKALAYDSEDQNLQYIVNYFAKECKKDDLYLKKLINSLLNRLTKANKKFNPDSNDVKDTLSALEGKFKAAHE
jgi:hypothetical protein